MGDEYYHYLINREGQEVYEVDGQYVVVGEAPTKTLQSAPKAPRAAETSASKCRAGCPPVSFGLIDRRERSAAVLSLTLVCDSG